MFYKFIFVVVAMASLAGCGEKSEQYYAEHSDEAREVLIKCTAMGAAALKDQNCLNAIEGNAKAVHQRNQQQAAARKASLKQMRDAADAQMKR